MVFSSSSRSFKRIFIILQLLWSGSLYANGCYTSIISFGDSLADTGNLKQLASIRNRSYPCLQPPYGETFFHQPGRASNGLLIIDFLAESLGLPLVPPFLYDKESENVEAFKHGVNYAIIGASSLDSSFLATRGIVNPLTNASLRVQLAWFKQSLPSICGNISDCRNLIERSLILMGEFGGNDYNFLIIRGGKPIYEVEPYVPLVTDYIISAVNELIDMGAQTLIVPGSFPLGCLSSYLTVGGSESEGYDRTTGCLIRFNKFAEYHNELLQTKLNHLRELHPNVIIIYADYYNAAMQIIRSPHIFGFTNGALKACCGSGGLYNYNQSAECGTPSASACDDPDTYVNWDGAHLTEAAYRIIFNNLFQGEYTWPRFNLLCPTSPSQVGVWSREIIQTMHTLDNILPQD